VVLECQFGPRRKNHAKKTAAKASFDASAVFRHSCPARYELLAVPEVEENPGFPHQNPAHCVSWGFIFFLFYRFLDFISYLG